MCVLYTKVDEYRIYQGSTTQTHIFSYYQKVNIERGNETKTKPKPVRHMNTFVEPVSECSKEREKDVKNRKLNQV